MRLHTRIGQCNVGMIGSKPAWQLFFKLDLTREEADLINTYRMDGKTLCRYTDNDGNESFLEVRDAVKGPGGHIFFDLGRLNAMKGSMIEGCAHFRNYLKQMVEIRSGGGQEAFEFSLRSDEIKQCSPPPASGNSAVPPPIEPKARTAPQDVPPIMTETRGSAPEPPPRKGPIILGDAPLK